MPPAQLADEKAQEQARDILRTKELNHASDKARKRLANAEADFKATLARQRLQWAQGEEEHAKRTKEMDAEVTALEKRKEQALIPIAMYSKQADEKMSEALECLNNAKVREAEVQEFSDRLEDRLDAVGEREQEVSKKEKQLLVRTQNIEHQELVIQGNAKGIDKKWIELIESQKKSDQEIFTKNEEFLLKERTLLAKEESLKRTEQTLSDLDKKLKDERGTLERAFARLKPLSPLPESETEV